MTAIYDFLLHVFGTVPAPIVACLLGWAMSFTVTQPLKFFLPLHWHPETREGIAQCVAFVTGLCVTVFLMQTWVGFFLGVMVGIWSPLAYYLTILLIERRFPWLADILSGDVRGKLLGPIRYTQKPRV